jgi:TATA-box binding protein (TBP) (component of TFIID and TFIIIB)
LRFNTFVFFCVEGFAKISCEILATMLPSLLSTLSSRSIIPIKSIPPALDLPRIENVVSTAVLLPPNMGFKLPLEALSLRIKCSQYAPILFAANIIKISDSITDSTALIFASGKIVVVASLSVNHTRYISQLIRMIIEQVSCMMRDAEGRIYEGSLLNRTVFEQCCIHNIVGSGDLHCRVDLQAMCDAAPMACKWFPDLFPGLKCKIWLTQSHMCECNASAPPLRGGAMGEIDPELSEPLALILGKSFAPALAGGSSGGGKCSCAVKMLIFDTGRIVVTGARTVQDINNVFFRIKKLTAQFSMSSTIPKNDRFYSRLSTMLVPTGETMKHVKVAPPAPPFGGGGGHLSNIMSTMEQKTKRQKNTTNTATQAVNTTTTALMRLCFAGRISDVRLLLQFDKDQVKERDANGFTVVERLMALPPTHRSAVHDEMLELLKIYA